MNELIYDKKECLIEYDIRQHRIYAKWIGYPLEESTKETMEVILRAMKQTNCFYYLSDLREMKGTFTGVNNWISNDWMPRALEAGYRACAMVYDADVFTKFATISLNKKYEKAKSLYPELLSKFHLRHFNSMQDASTWIQERQRADADREA